MSYDRTLEPTVIVKGERITWTRTFCDYSAAEYTLQYRFRGAATGVNVTATADGADFDVDLTAVLSATFGGTGVYKWQAWLTEIAASTNTFVVAEGRVRVDAGFVSATTAVEVRTIAKQTLDAITAAMLGRASSTQLEWEITTPAGSRRIKSMSAKELTDMQSYYTRIVAREDADERVRLTGRYKPGPVARFKDA
jgi:hypothetical protein